MLHITPTGYNDQGFALSAAFVLVWTAMANFRVARHLPECRVMALFFGTGLLLYGGAWTLFALPSATWIRLDQHHPAALLLVVLFHPLLTLAFALLAPARYDVPMHTEYHIARYACMLVLCMGQVALIR